MEKGIENLKDYESDDQSYDIEPEKNDDEDYESGKDIVVDKSYDIEAKKDDDNYYDIYDDENY